MDHDGPDSSAPRERDSRDRPPPPPRERDSRDRPFDPAAKAMNREVAASEAAKRSKKDCRVYVGNLSFGVKWNDLKDFMREGGLLFFWFFGAGIGFGMQEGGGVTRAAADLTNCSAERRSCVLARHSRESDGVEATA